jgi:nucleotide-binding universal stress UspA family protein
MKNILLLIHDDEGQEARYQVALDVARAVGGHIRCLDLTIIPEYVGDYAPFGPGGMLLAENDVAEARHGRHMLARIGREDVSFDWIGQTGFLEQSLEARSALTDLIVLSTDDAWELFPHMTHVIGDILVHTGRPVLAVPPSCQTCNVGGEALVAWDGSEDAEAALSASLPLLQLAGSVVLFHVDDGSMQTSADEAARYLSRHGIDCEIKSEPVRYGRVAETLLAEITKGQPDYVVMGGFGHARTLEAIFGGVTRAMLKECDVPMLLVHRR